MATLKERLDAYEGQPEQPWNKRKSAAVGERGQKYTVKFSKEILSAVYAIDGGIIKDINVIKCDKLVLLDVGEHKLLELFVELKGGNIQHAIEQVKATLRNPLFKDASVIERQARIIGRKIPSNTGNSITERAKKNFLVKFNCRLEFKTAPAVETLSVNYLNQYK